MGSGLTQAYVATWGALIEEKTLAADSATIQISSIPPSWKYLHIFLNLRSDQALGPVAYTMTASDGAASYSGTYSEQDPPNVLTVTNYGGAAGWICEPLGDNTQNVFSEWVINQDPAIVIKSAFVRSDDPNNSSIYTANNQVVLPAGETTINTIKLTAGGAAKFKAGSKMTIYGLN